MRPVLVGHCPQRHLGAGDPVARRRDRRRRVRSAPPRRGARAGVVVLASAATSTLVKRIAERPEIAQSTTPNSFPSGHATIALAALFAVLMVTPRRFRPVVTLIGVAYAVFVANQTVVYGWHRVSDIVGRAASRCSGSGSSGRAGRASTEGSAATGTDDGLPVVW
ncbi:phosphatase PAP2 family protein [Curtobacterium flaccumfaciens]|nr:phosphatase PAP2 family protein [Curtobacterium flaccumfaciens]